MLCLAATTGELSPRFNTMAVGAETAWPCDINIWPYQLTLLVEPLHQPPSSLLLLSKAWVIGQAGPTSACVHTAWPIITKFRAYAKSLMLQCLQQCTALHCKRGAM